MTTTTEEEAEADQGRTSRAALALFIDSRRVASFFKCQRKKKQNRTEPDGEERSVSGQQTGTSTGSKEEGRKEPRPRCGCKWRRKMNEERAALMQNNTGTRLSAVPLESVPSLKWKLATCT